jgi:Cof subfamily protein (haloacid dehalogenase superfamily)
MFFSYSLFRNVNIVKYRNNKSVVLKNKDELEMNIEAVVIDLDGTLLNSNRTTSKTDIETLHYLGEKKVCRIIATGRSYYACMQVLPSDFPIDFLIFSAGAGIMNYKTKEIFYVKYIEANDVKIIVKRLWELEIDFQVRLKVPNGHKYYYKRFLEINPDFDFLNNAYKPHIKLLKKLSQLPDATRVIAISPEKENVELIFEEFKMFSVIKATSPVNNSSHWIEIFQKNVNKGSALSYLTEKLMLNLENICGLGNDYNDIDFLNITGKSFMVENAPEDLKKMYELTVSNDENPLSKVIKTISII